MAPKRADVQGAHSLNDLPSNGRGRGRGRAARGQGNKRVPRAQKHSDVLQKTLDTVMFKNLKTTHITNVIKSAVKSKAAPKSSRKKTSNLSDDDSEKNGVNDKNKKDHEYVYPNNCEVTNKTTDGASSTSLFACASPEQELPVNATDGSLILYLIAKFFFSLYIVFFCGNAFYRSCDLLI